MKHHGSYKIKVSNDVLVIRCSGSWNKETTLRYAEDYKATASVLINTNWAVICDLRDWTLATPESMPIFQSLMNWCFDQGLKSCAYVYNDSFIKKRHLEEMTLSLQSLPENYKFIRQNTTEGIYCWLKNSGYTPQEQDIISLNEQTQTTGKPEIDLIMI